MVVEIITTHLSPIRRQIETIIILSVGKDVEKQVLTPVNGSANWYSLPERPLQYRATLSVYLFDPAFPLEEFTQLIGHWEKNRDRKMLLTALSLCDIPEANEIYFNVCR